MKTNNADELFRLENPENWWYQVRLYIVNHRQLQIKVSNESTNETRYINFAGVEFYNGPLSWSGGNISIADSEECLQVLRTIETYKNYSDAELTDFALYTIKPREGRQIYILASGQPSLTEDNLFSNYVP